MGKSSLSVSVDNELMKYLDGKKNKSETINQILRRTLMTKEGIEEEIEYHKNQIGLLNKELDYMKQRDNRKIENISEELKNKLVNIKGIITNDPDKIYIWTTIINRDYNQNINPDELRKLIKRWC